MLKLSALDLEDLAVISAQMQDAVLLAGDMRYDPKRKHYFGRLFGPSGV